MVLWDYVIQRRDSFYNAVPRPLFQSDGQTPHVSNFVVQGFLKSVQLWMVLVGILP